MIFYILHFIYSGIIHLVYNVILTWRLYLDHKVYSVQKKGTLNPNKDIIAEYY